MSAKRGASGLSGILLVDKPSGMTSHDVVNRVRRAAGEKRVGHAGTLDPMATGLLVVLVGPATRLAPYLSAADKVYEARIVFGSETDTDDAQGTCTREAPVPADLLDTQFAESRVTALLGTREQVPPAYSAIKRDGVTAYAAARSGGPLELEARTIEVRTARLDKVLAGPPVSWDALLSVSKGTYIRAIARDLGRELGTAAHLGALRRIESGGLKVSDAVSLDEIAAAGERGELPALFVDPVAALPMPALPVGPEKAARVANGSALSLGDLEGVVTGARDGDVVAVTADGAVLGIYGMSGDSLKAVTVIPGGVAKGPR